MTRAHSSRLPPSTSREFCLILDVMRYSINQQCSTEAGLRDYITNNYIPEISQSDLAQLLKLYPADITQGSPFNTSILNALTPVFKRLAAMQGDLVFQAPRRFFLQNRSSKQSTWSFCEFGSKRKRVQVACANHLVYSSEQAPEGYPCPWISMSPKLPPV